MDDLQKARNTIDQIDCEMAKLFCLRMDAVKGVVKSKNQTGKAIFDPVREKAVVEKNLNYIHNEEYKAYYEDFMVHTMQVSRHMQAKMLNANTVAYQGVEGAFSHIAAKATFPQGNSVAYPTWQDVFEAVKNGDATYGILPFENSQAGDVTDVLDLCFEYDLQVQNMVDLPVHHNLLSIEGATLSDIKEVYSHPQALNQCRHFLNSLGVQIYAMDNTAIAAKHIADLNDKTKAAVASQNTADLYKLKVVASNINTSDQNTTRFIVIGKGLNTQGDHFSLLFTVTHKTGSLATFIQGLAALGYNMENIKSRPISNTPWEYYFYVEIQGELTQEKQSRLLNELKGKSAQTVRVLGIYNKELLIIN